MEHEDEDDEKDDDDDDGDGQGMGGGGRGGGGRGIPRGRGMGRGEGGGGSSDTGERKAVKCGAARASDDQLANGATASRLWSPMPTRESSSWQSIRSRSGGAAVKMSSVPVAVIKVLRTQRSMSLVAARVIFGDSARMRSMSLGIAQSRRNWWTNCGLMRG